MFTDFNQKEIYFDNFNFKNDIFQKEVERKRGFLAP